MSWWSKKKSKQKKFLSTGAYSHAGCVRKENQDAYGIYERDGEYLLLVADGMGGHSNGQEASKAAVNTIYESHFEDLSRSMPNRLRSAFLEANRHVHDIAKSNEGQGPMGTTATALAIQPNQIILAHVGDSVAYLFKGEKAKKLTVDHTVAQKMFREGILTEQEAQEHPRRGTLTQAIGMGSEIDIDVIRVGVPNAGDRFLICSDGLSEVGDSLMSEIVTSKNPKRASQILVEKANTIGGYDNSTAIVAVVDG